MQVRNAVGAVLRRARGALKSAAYSGPGRARWQHPDRVVEALSIEERQVVADVGAGGGYFTYRLAQAVGPQGRVFAVDTDDDMRARIRRRAARGGFANVTTVEPQGDAASLPEPVDLALVVDAFHHLPEDRVAYFSDLKGSLRPSGRLAVIEKLPRWYLFGHATDPDQIRSTLVDAGYVAVVEHEFLPSQSFRVFQPSG